MAKTAAASASRSRAEPGWPGLPVRLLVAELRAARPWDLRVHPGDLLRRAFVTAAREVGGPWADGWLDRRGAGDQAPFALRLRLARSGEGVTGLVMELRTFGPWPAPAVGPWLRAAVERMAEKGLSMDQVPHSVTELLGPATAPLGAWAGPPPPPGPLRLRLRSPLSLGRGPGPEDPPTPADLFAAAVRRLRGLEAAAGLEPGPALAPPGAAARARSGQLRWEGWLVRGIRNPNAVRREGFVGELILDGPLGDLPRALAAAAVTQLGRAVTSGHGVIELRPA